MEDARSAKVHAPALFEIAERQISGSAIATVNARDLHAFLDVGRDFSNWIKDRIEKYGFTQDVDFVSSPNLANNDFNGLRSPIDYHLSLDMAKELAMVERNAKGKQARQYFIECERQLKGRPAPAAIAIMAPKAEALERIAEADGTYCRTDAAKILSIPPHVLIRWLRTNEWTYRRVGMKDDLAYQARIASCVLDHKIETFDKAGGSVGSRTQVRITAKGLTKLATFFGVHEGLFQ
jgi:phage anti-repressor protein